MPIYRYKNWTPVIDPSAFVHPMATITGDVVIGPRVYVGPGAQIRGDWGQVNIEIDCNIQENCVIHMFPGLAVSLASKAHIGHGAVIHGATIGANSLIGMNAVIMDRARVGGGCIIGALTLVLPDTVIPDRSLVVGNPGRIINTVSDEMLAWKTRGTEKYINLPEEMNSDWHVTQPMSALEPDRERHETDHEVWKKS